VGKDRLGNDVEALSVRVGRINNGPRLGGPGLQLEREDLLLILDLKQRDWRQHRASLADRGHILRIGLKLEQALAVSEFAETSFGISPSTYRRWRRKASTSESN
jgi:hypothetical protein